MRLTDPEMNRLRLLKAIRRAEPVARTDLTALTGLSGGAITDLTGDFLRGNILVEDRAPLPGKGRPRLQLRLNPDGPRVVGASVYEDATMRVVIANVRGDTVYAETIIVRTRPPNVAILGGQLADIIAGVLRNSGAPLEDINCVGLGLPGVVDSVRGVVEWLQTFPLEPVPLAALVQEKLGLPVLVDSTFNAVARAEHWFGDGQVDDFCMIGLGMGVGFSRYAAGALRIGGHGINSEFGHVKMMLDAARQCSCGAYGCLSAYCTTYGIVSQICEARKLPLPAYEHFPAMLETFAAEAQAGDMATLAIFQQAGKMLGLALSNYVNTSDPARVIVILLDAGLELIRPPLELAFQAGVLPGLRGKASLEFRAYDRESHSRGSAALALERLGRTGSEIHAV